MIDENELLFVVDEHNQPVAPLPRQIVHQKNVWHRTTGIWVINKKHQILCQKRSLKKDMNPGLWEAAFGGHVGPQETYLDNATAELGEELGIVVDKNHLIPYSVLQFGNEVHKKFESLFLYELDREDRNFPIEEVEVAEIRWIPLTELKTYLFNKDYPDWVHNPWDKDLITWIEQRNL